VPHVPIERHRLANGLRIVLSPDNRAPVVAVNLWYRVGSRHEVAGRTGLAHLFEHLMFQGSRNVASGEHFAIVQGMGGHGNATTSLDFTNYFETLPVEGLETALWLEADRMGGLLDAVNQANLDNQRDVVRNERRERYENPPYGTALERLVTSAFPPGHQYDHLPIGSMADLEAADLADAHAFFARHYTPANAVLTLVGDIEGERGLDLAEHYFGGIEGPAAPPGPPRDAGLAPLADPVALAERDEQVPRPVVYFMWRVPATGDPRMDAAEVALDGIAAADSAPLRHYLTREARIASEVSAAVVRLVGGTSLAMLAVNGAAGVDPDRLREETAERLDLLAASSPSEHEVALAVAGLEREYAVAASDVDTLADALGEGTCLHDDPAWAGRLLDAARSVTPDQAREAQRTLLDPRTAVTLTYHVPA